MPNRDFNAVCGGKTPFPSRELARQAANHQRLEGKLPGKVETYSCPFSGASSPHWHFGHISRGKARRQKKFGHSYIDRMAQ